LPRRQIGAQRVTHQPPLRYARRCLHQGHDPRPPFGVGKANDDRRVDVRKALERALDGHGVHLDAARVDDVIGTAKDAQTPLLIHLPKVARRKPPHPVLGDKRGVVAIDVTQPSVGPESQTRPSTRRNWVSPMGRPS